MLYRDYTFYFIHRDSFSYDEDVAGVRIGVKSLMWINVNKKLENHLNTDKNPKYPPPLLHEEKQIVDHKDIQLQYIMWMWILEYLFLVNSNNWVVCYDTLKTKEPWHSHRPAVFTAFVFFCLAHIYTHSKQYKTCPNTHTHTQLHKGSHNCCE